MPVALSTIFYIISIFLHINASLFRKYPKYAHKKSGCATSAREPKVPFGGCKQPEHPP